MPIVAFNHLTPDERLLLIGELWDSLDSRDVGLTPTQTAELSRRLTTLDKDIAEGSTWDDIEAELDRRYR